MLVPVALGRGGGVSAFLQGVNPTGDQLLLKWHSTLALGWPRLKWVVTDSKYLSKSPKDWQPNISAAGPEPAYIEVRREWGGESSFPDLDLLLQG